MSQLAAPPDRPEAPPTAVAAATFSVPAVDVWAYRLDFANLPEYNPDVSGVRQLVHAPPGGVGGVHGSGARYGFALADPAQPGVSHHIELWTLEVERPTLVTAGMSGRNDAYEEFALRALDGGGCEATLRLWVTLPQSLPAAVVESAARGSLEQISKELRLMKQVLESRAAL